MYDAEQSIADYARGVIDLDSLVAVLRELPPATVKRSTDPSSAWMEAADMNTTDPMSLTSMLARAKGKGLLDRGQAEAVYAAVRGGKTPTKI